MTRRFPPQLSGITTRLGRSPRRHRRLVRARHRGSGEVLRHLPERARWQRCGPELRRERGPGRGRGLLLPGARRVAGGQARPGRSRLRRTRAGPPRQGLPLGGPSYPISGRPLALSAALISATSPCRRPEIGGHVVQSRRSGLRASSGSPGASPRRRFLRTLAMNSRRRSSPGLSPLLGGHDSCAALVLLPPPSRARSGPLGDGRGALLAAARGLERSPGRSSRPLPCTFIARLERAAGPRL